MEIFKLVPPGLASIQDDQAIPSLHKKGLSD